MKLKYDAKDYTLRGTSEVLTERYPHLTYAEHVSRQHTALHEASHLITAMVLPTGRVGTDAIVRVPRVPAGLKDVGSAMGAVHVSADGWELAIVSFAGIAGAFISNDPDKDGCNSDVGRGMTTVHDLARIRDTQTIYDIRWELLTKSFQIVAEYWPVIDLTATSLLLNARKGGGIVDRRFVALVAMAHEAITEADSDSLGHPRSVSFLVPSAVTALIRKRVNLPSRILQQSRPISGLEYGYPYE